MFDATSRQQQALQGVDLFDRPCNPDGSRNRIPPLTDAGMMEPRRPVLLVGEQPPERWLTDPVYREKHSPMFPYPPNSAGGRLFKVSDLGLGEYIHGLDRVNLIPTYKRWDVKEARANAKALLRERQPSHVFLCGRRVASAFGFQEDTELPHKIRSGVADAHLIAIPHPSGRNHAYNNGKVCEWVRVEFEKVKPLLGDWAERRRLLLTPPASE